MAASNKSLICPLCHDAIDNQKEEYIEVRLFFSGRVCVELHVNRAVEPLLSALAQGSVKLLSIAAAGRHVPAVAG